MPSDIDLDTGRLRIEAPSVPLDATVEEKLRRELGRCPDVAFAHLTQVQVPEYQSVPTPTLFVWTSSAAVRSVRMALNLVSEAVSRALPREQYLDVVILNSAPELLQQVEAAGCLLVENDRRERQLALQAMSGQRPSSQEPSPSPSRSKRPWWWPF